ncbi:glutamine--tRNA ligase/YqeY domain fusion protein [bacterium]|nr:glutamine--tRNA ligase/YqeY domain fusion protein [bacterium]
MPDTDNKPSQNFIKTIISEDILNNKNNARVHTRFPPEPNGYLHIGHAKSICLNFGIAEQFNGLCNLRFDDTNPAKEEIEYVESIMEDVKWLGFDWEDRLYFASEYFDKFYEYAIQLIKDGNAYVDSLTPDEIRQYRGTLTEPGKNSPYRNRSIKENMELFEKMKNGELEEGTHLLRAKIDMTSPNLNMRDPAIYRIKKASHHRTNDKWCIYPMYDFAHGLEDSIEKITHSICTLEFEDHRPLYDWFLEKLNVFHPRQIEFARLNLTYTVMSKRKLKKLVDEKYVSGWDDPRMPTVAGLRRRGYTAESIRNFCDTIGVAKRESTVDIALLEHCLREDLNKRAPRVMAVLHPLKVTITNYPDNKVEQMQAVNNPEDESAGTRLIPFSKTVYIEKDDFMENPPKKYFRLSPGKEIRLKHAYYIKCEKVIRNENTGEITELLCTYDPASKGGWTNDGRKVRGTSHWVSVDHALDAEIRLYNHLFTKQNPENVPDGQNFLANINPDSLEILKNCKVEQSLLDYPAGSFFQFMRQGYFSKDKDSANEKMIFNRSVSLKDTWAKIQKK